MNETISAHLKTIGKPYTLLYVEDDQGISDVMCKILTLFCGTLHHAKNGQEGLALYHALKPDLIVTDISMPVMDGISMIRAIREVDQQIPIMINSAFSDQSYLLDSIYLGVDRYTVKPIRQDAFLDALYFLFTKLDNARQAKLYEKIKRLEEANSASTKMLKSMLHIFPHGMIVTTVDGRVQFLNAFIMALFDLENTEQKDHAALIASRFIASESTIHCLQDVEENALLASRLVVRTHVAKKIFMVFKRSIETEEFGQLFIYSLIDITRAEYEKQKNQNLSRLFREMIRPKSSKIVPDKSDRVTPEIGVKRYENIRLEAMHYTEKVSALTYTQSLDEVQVEELEEMEELEAELGETLNAFEEEGHLSNLYDIAFSIERYSKTIGSLIDFEDVSFSLTKLSTLLRSMTTLEKNSRKLHLLLSGIVDDLRQWRHNIFITKEAKDIHYLDASLLSSCLQIEIEFFGGSLQEEELDLF